MVSQVTRRWSVAVAAVLIALIAGPATFSQDADDSDPAEPSIDLEIDIGLFIASDHALDGPVQDAVWQVEAQPGGLLIQIPLIVKLDAAGPIELQSSTLRVRGGRFVAWQIVDDIEDEAQQQQQGPSRQRVQPGSDYLPGQRSQRPGKSTVPLGAPRLARKVTINADGTVQWSLESRISGGTVIGSTAVGQGRAAPRQTQRQRPQRTQRQSSRRDRSQRAPRTGRTGARGAGGFDPMAGRRGGRTSGSAGRGIDPVGLGGFGGPGLRGSPGGGRGGSRRGGVGGPGAGAGDQENLYPYRVAPGLLRQQRPERPQRMTRNSGEDARAFQERRRQVAQEHRAQEAAYKELRKKVGALATDFKQEMPRRLWAIFSVAGGTSELQVSGIKPDTWSISMDDLELLQGQLSNDFHAMQRLSRLVAGDAHPYTHRAAAHGLSLADIAADAQPLDPLYQFMQSLLQSPDTESRRVTAAALATVDPPTPATAALLRIAARDADPAIRLEAIRSVLNASTSTPAQLNQAIMDANRYLNDAQGVMPQSVLAMLLDKGQLDPDSHGLIITAVRFDTLSGDRLDDAISYVVSQAVVDPVAEGWLDQRLLGSPAPNVVKRTLEILDTANVGKAFVEPTLVGLLDSWLGPAKVAQEDEGSVKLALDGRIPITSTRHHLFSALQSGNAEVRDLAWQSLRLFEFVPEQQQQQQQQRRRGRRGQPAQQEVPYDHLDPYAVLVDAALDLDDTPEQLPGFLLRQDDYDRAALGLVHLTIAGSPRVAASAGRLLVGSSLPVGDALTSRTIIEAADLKRFADTVYGAYKIEPPLVTALLTDQPQDNPAVTWFGDEIAFVGTLPDRKLWADGFGGEQYLLDAIAGTRDEQVVLAATDALVAEAGGSPEQSRQIAKDLMERKKEPGTKILAAWHKHRHKVHLSRIEAASGKYQLSLLVYPRDPNAPVPRGVAAGRGAGPTAAELGLEGGQPAGRPAPPRGGVGPGPGGFGAGGMGGMGRGPLFDPMMMPGGFGRGRTGSQEVKTYTQPPELTVELGDIELTVQDGKVSFGAPSIRLSVPKDYLAIRLNKPSELTNLAGRDLGQVNLERTAAIDLFPDDHSAWRGDGMLADGRPIQLVMRPGR